MLVVEEMMAKLPASTISTGTPGELGLVQRKVAILEAEMKKANEAIALLTSFHAAVNSTTKKLDERLDQIEDTAVQYGDRVGLQQGGQWVARYPGSDAQKSILAVNSPRETTWWAVRRRRD